MANPNKTARGSANTPAARRATEERVKSEPMVADMARVQSGEMTPEEFKAKYAA